MEKRETCAVHEDFWSDTFQGRRMLHDSFGPVVRSERYRARLLRDLQAENLLQSFERDVCKVAA